MIAQLSVYPIGEGTSLSRFVKKGVSVIEESGYTYEVGGMSTSVEVPDLPGVGVGGIGVSVGVAVGSDVAVDSGIAVSVGASVFTTATAGSSVAGTATSGPLPPPKNWLAAKIPTPSTQITPRIPTMMIGRGKFILERLPAAGALDAGMGPVPAEAPLPAAAACEDDCACDVDAGESTGGSTIVPLAGKSASTRVPPVLPPSGIGGSTTVAIGDESGSSTMVAPGGSGVLASAVLARLSASFRALAIWLAD